MRVALFRRAERGARINACFFVKIFPSLSRFAEQLRINRTRAYLRFTHSFQSLDPVNKSDLEDDLKRLNVCISVDTKDVRRRMVH